MLWFWLTSTFKMWFTVSEKIISLLSIIEFLQFARLLNADICASIFQISCHLQFLSIGIAGWVKISERPYWEFSSPIFEWFDYVIYENLSGIS